jgi:hypothetical protein
MDKEVLTVFRTRILEAAHIVVAVYEERCGSSRLPVEYGKAGLRDRGSRALNNDCRRNRTSLP